MKKIFAIFFMIGIVIAAGYFYKYPFLEPNEGAPAGQESPAAKKFRFAAVIDNSPPARPQSGLAKADLVIEAPAEASFTRLLAFFQSQEAEAIGPVRSARPYFLDWARGFESIAVHSGGSSEALSEIAANPGIKSINEFYNADYIKRDKAKPAPHNLFTSSERLAKRAKQDWDETDLDYGFIFKADAPAGEGAAKSIAIDFNNPAFDVEYRYEPAANSYLRFLGGLSHEDRETGRPLAAKNVVVMETTSLVLDETLLTIDLRTSGSGPAAIFRDGQAVRARWRKVSSTSPLELIDAQGLPIELNRGQTWIEVLDQRHGFSFE